MRSCHASLQALVDSLLRFVADPEDAAVLLHAFPLQCATISNYEALRNTGMRPEDPEDAENLLLHAFPLQDATISKFRY